MTDTQIPVRVPEDMTDTVPNRLRPWVHLGSQITQKMSIDEALRLVEADDHVEPITLQTMEGEEVKSHLGVKSSIHGVMWAVRPSYEITQRREILEFAYEIAGLARSDAYVESIGNLGQFREQFFAYIRFPTLVIDPSGIADEVETGLYAATSFNGTWANIIGYSMLRLSCMNQLNQRLRKLDQTIQVRHTRNSAQRLQEAAEAVGYIGKVEKQLIANAETMLNVRGESAMNKITDHFYPKKEDMSKAALTRRETTLEILWDLYSGPGNTSADVAGRNGWAAYQAFTEFLDHYRPTRGGTTRAYGATFPGKIVNQKVKASDLVLSLA